MDEAVWDQAVFSKNPERLLNQESAAALFPTAATAGQTPSVRRTFHGERDADQGLEKVSWWFTFAGAAYNLIRLRRLRAEAVAV